MTDDGQLLREYVETQAETAFAELVRRHLGLVYHAALRRLDGDHHAAHDIAQAVFILLARKARMLQGHPSLTGWLYSTVNFEVSTFLRAIRRRGLREEKVAQLLGLERSEDRAEDSEALRPVLDEALMSLSVRDRHVILLRFFEGKTNAEIGERLSFSEAAAQKRVLRALGKLREHLARRRIVSTSAALAAIMTAESSLAAPAALMASIPAIAVNTAGMSPGGAVFAFMTIVKSTAGAASLATAAAILGLMTAGLGLHHLHVARHGESAARSVRMEIDSNVNRLAKLRRDLADREGARSKPSGPPMKSAPSATRSVSSSSQNPRSSLTPQEAKSEGAKFLAAYPQATNMFLNIFKSDAARTYRPFFRSVDMTPEETARLEDAIAQSRLETLAITPKGFGDTTAVLPPDEQLRAELGEARSQQFQDYRKVQPAFDFASHSALAVKLAGDQISLAQEDQLAQVIVKNSAMPEGAAQINLATVNWNQALPQAQALVSPTQWSALEPEFLRMQYNQALAAAKAGSGPVGSR